MLKFLSLCFLAGLVSLPNITSTADAVPVTNVPTVRNTTSGKRVEVFATNLKLDLEKQEAILLRYIKGLEADRNVRNVRLKRLQFTLADLKAKLLNATQTYNAFDKQVVSQQRTFAPLDASFKQASQMYEKDMKNLKEEKAFVDALLRYIKLKKC
jgi:hypothetical protein